MFKEYGCCINYDNLNEGFIQGFVSDEDDIFFDFLKSYDYIESDIEFIDKYKNCKKAYISNLYIDEEYRGNKYGTLLLNEILLDIYSDYDVKYIFLICYNIEQNSFSLQNWYQSYGFVAIANKMNCPLMVLDNNSIIY